MTDRLSTLLAEGRCLLADGAMGTNLFARGLPNGGCPELWNVERPEAVLAVHQGFVGVGSDIILTNSFGGTRSRLKLHGAEGRVGELNQAAARLARRAADEAGRTVAVGGSMGPTGELFEPLGPLTLEVGTAVFAEQAQALAEGGADVLWIETMSSREEVQAAVAGARAAGLPIVATMTFDTNGRTMMGIAPGEAKGFFDGLEPHLAACGANCGNGPGELVAAVLGLVGAAGPGDIVVAKGNCGIPEYVEGHIRYSGTPEVMADYARLARAAGARIVGGCCGSTAEHVAAMAKALREPCADTAPSLDEVAARLGLNRVVTADRAAAPRRRRREAGRA
ncbi:MAG: betaine--homocysteine S-methyltransferase [Alphaproteobacteria bacterium]